MLLQKDLLLFHIFLNLDRRFWNQILTFVEKGPEH